MNGLVQAPRHLREPAKPQTLDGIQTITFADSAPATSAFYAQPLLLTQTGTIPNITVSASDPSDMMANSSMEGWSGTVNNGSSHTVTPNHFVGFWAGTDSSYKGALTDCNVTSSATGTDISFAMGWKDSNGGFHPYSYQLGFFTFIYGVVNNNSAIGGDRTGGIHGSFANLGGLARLDRSAKPNAFLEWPSGPSGWPFSSAATTPFPVSANESVVQ